LINRWKSFIVLFPFYLIKLSLCLFLLIFLLLLWTIEPSIHIVVAMRLLIFLFNLLVGFCSLLSFLGLIIHMIVPSHYIKISGWRRTLFEARFDWQNNFMSVIIVFRQHLVIYDVVNVANWRHRFVYFVMTFTGSAVVVLQCDDVIVPDIPPPHVHLHYRQLT